MMNKLVSRYSFINVHEPAIGFSQELKPFQ
jgi:hypothetical protein